MSKIRDKAVIALSLHHFQLSIFQTYTAVYEMPAELFRRNCLCGFLRSAQNRCCRTGCLSHCHADSHDPVRRMCDVRSGNAPSCCNQIVAPERAHCGKRNIIRFRTAGAFFVMFGLAGSCRIVNIQTEMCLVYHSIRKSFACQ